MMGHRGRIPRPCEESEACVPLNENGPNLNTNMCCCLFFKSKSAKKDLLSLGVT